MGMSLVEAEFDDHGNLKPSPLSQLPTPAAPITDEQKLLLKRTAGGGELNDDEFTLFLVVAARLGLDPLTKQLFALKFNNRATRRKEMVILVPIVGQRTACQRAGLDDGMDGPEFTADGLNWTSVWLDEEHPPAAARCTVYRKGSAHGFTGTVTWHEFAKDTTGPGGAFWKDMPSLMLGKCAEALARRQGFADTLSGVYEPAEYAQVQAEVTVNAKPKENTSSAAPRLNQPGTGGSSSTPDDAWLAPINYHLLNSQPKGEGAIDQAKMGALFKDGRRTRQFTVLFAYHQNAEMGKCAHLRPDVEDAARKLGLMSGEVAGDLHDPADDGDQEGDKG